MKINQVLGLTLIAFSAARLLQPFGGVGGYMAVLVGAWLDYLLIAAVMLAALYLSHKPRTWQQTSIAALPFTAYWVFALAYTVSGLGNIGMSAVYGALVLLPISYLYRKKIAPRTIRGRVLHSASPSKITGLASLITGADVLLRGQVGAFPYIQELVAISPQVYGWGLVLAGAYLLGGEHEESSLFLLNMPIVIYGLFYSTYLGILGAFVPIPLWLGYIALIMFCASQIKDGTYAHLDETLEPDSTNAPSER